MATNLEIIKSYLTKFNMHFNEIKERNELFLTFGNDKNRLGMIISTIDNGAIFVAIIKLLKQNGENWDFFGVAKDHKNINLLFNELLKYNYELKFGSWEFFEGDLRFVVKIPLMDSELLSNQFARILNIFPTILEYGEKIFYILEHGKIMPEKVDVKMDAQTKAEFDEFVKAKKNQNGRKNG